MPEVGEGSIQGADDNKLFMRWSVPDNAQSCVVIVHGLGEHSGRYSHAVEAMSAKGIAVYSYDHRGHGQSDGRRSHVRRFDAYLADLNVVLEEVKNRQGQGSLFVWGHSMGGIIASLYAIQYRPTLWGVVITGAPYELAIPISKAKILAARILSNIVPSLALDNEVDPAGLSRDQEVGKAFQADKLTYSKATVRWGAEFLDAIDRANARAQEFELPLLLARGSEDPICTAAGLEGFLKRAKSEIKSFHSFEKCRHELHNELQPERGQFFDLMTQWIAERSA